MQESYKNHTHVFEGNFIVMTSSLEVPVKNFSNIRILDIDLSQSDVDETLRSDIIDDPCTE